MKHNSFRLIKTHMGRLSWLTFVGFLSLLVAVIAPQHGYTQEIIEPQLIVKGIDIDKFPDVYLQISSENIDMDPSILSVSVREDRVEQTILEQQILEVGTQTAILIDTNVGQESNPPNSDEIRNLIAALGNTGIWSSQTDWLAAFATDEFNLRTLSEWTQDIGLVTDSITDLQIQEDDSKVSPVEAILRTLDQFDNVSDNNHPYRSILFFSTGTVDRCKRYSTDCPKS